MPHRGQHLDVVVEVAHKGHDVHALIEALNAAELHHESVLITQLLQWLPVALILPQQLHLGFGGQEAHQALHKVHTQRPQVEPEKKNKHQY